MLYFKFNSFLKRLTQRHLELGKGQLKRARQDEKSQNGSLVCNIIPALWSKYMI